MDQDDISLSIKDEPIKDEPIACSDHELQYEGEMIVSCFVVCFCSSTAATILAYTVEYSRL